MLVPVTDAIRSSSRCLLGRTRMTHEHHSGFVSLNVQIQVGDWVYAAPEAAVFSSTSSPMVRDEVSGQSGA